MNTMHNQERMMTDDAYELNDALDHNIRSIFLKANENCTLLNHSPHVLMFATALSNIVLTEILKVSKLGMRSITVLFNKIPMPENFWGNPTYSALGSSPFSKDAIKAAAYNLLVDKLSRNGFDVQVVIPVFDNHNYNDSCIISWL